MPVVLLDSEVKAEQHLSPLLVLSLDAALTLQLLSCLCLQQQFHSHESRYALEANLQTAPSDLTHSGPPQ